MDCRGNLLNLDVRRLQKLSFETAKFLEKECRDPIEAVYVLKATRYMVRGAIIEVGIVVDNEAQLEAELTGMTDKGINEGE